MIDVKHLTRTFAGVTAVNDLSFSVEAGDVTALLGPNGAGKTTTVRLLAGYLQPTGGTVTVGGLDLDRDSLELRRHIGYLPENAPVYPELRVREHLELMGGLYGMSLRKRLQRIEWVLNACGLEEAANRIIGVLSRGFRQRVGLAAAMLHDPDVLILDEPTAGLDPNQGRAIRDVIRGLGGSRTILLSTHSLMEAETLCKRVMILHKGRLVALDTPAELRRRSMGASRVAAEIRAPLDDVREKCGLLLFAESVEVEADGEWVRVRILSRNDIDLRPDLFKLAVRENWTVRELRADNHSLEDVFVSLTREEALHV
jgi:ABC-2 type transport system ATP-binding protein